MSTSEEQNAIDERCKRYKKYGGIIMNIAISIYVQHQAANLDEFKGIEDTDKAIEQSGKAIMLGETFVRVMENVLDHVEVDSLMTRLDPSKMGSMQ